MFEINSDSKTDARMSTGISTAENTPDTDMPMDELTLALRFEYEYDDTGNKIRQTGYDNAGNVNSYAYEYTAEPDGIRVKETSCGPNGSTRQFADYRYDAYGDLTERAYYSGNNHIVTRFYSAAENYSAVARMLYRAKAVAGSFDVIRYIGYDNGAVTEFATARYDAKGNRIRETIHFADDSLMYSYEYEYDTAGNVTKEAVYDADGALLNVGQFEYRYDEHGNILEKRRYWNGEFVGLTKYSYVQVPSQTIL